MESGGGWLNYDNSMLILDTFRCHRKPKFIKHLQKQHKTEIVIIPGSMTSILQPVDVGCLNLLCCCWLPTPMTLASGGSAMFPLDGLPKSVCVVLVILMSV